jgi:hypothetical protein
LWFALIVQILFLIGIGLIVKAWCR